MNPVAVVLFSFITYTAVKGQLASYWALATKKNVSAQAPTNQVATLQPTSTGQANTANSPAISPTTIGTVIGSQLGNLGP